MHKGGCPGILPAAGNLDGLKVQQLDSDLAAQRLARRQMEHVQLLSNFISDSHQAAGDLYGLEVQQLHRDLAAQRLAQRQVHGRGDAESQLRQQLVVPAGGGVTAVPPAAAACRRLRAAGEQ